MRVSEAIGRLLVDSGVEAFFGLAGSGKFAVVSVHQGPGFTNTLTGLTEAAKASTPLLVLAADIPVETLWSNFKVDQAALAATVGAIPERVRGPETAAADTA